MDKFTQYKLELTDKNKKSVKEYLQHTQEIVDKYNIEKELYDDIEERLFEKLSSQKKLDELSIRKVLKEIGEPEVVFADFIFPQGNEKIKGNFEIGTKIKKISKKTKNWLGNLWFLLKTAIKTPIPSLINFIKWLWKSTILLIKKIFKLILQIIKQPMKALKYILPTLRFIFFIIFAIILFSILITLIICFSALLSGITFNNIDYFSVLPAYTKGGFLFGIVAFGIFFVASLLYSLGKKINLYWLIGGFVSFIIMISLSVSTFFSLINTYGKFNEYNQVISYELGQNKDIVLNLYGLVDKRNFPFRGVDSVILENSTGSDLKLEIKYTLLGNDELVSIFKNSIVEPKIVEKNGILELEKYRIFSVETPFIPFYRNLIIYVPEGYTINFGRNFFPYIANVWVAKGQFDAILGKNSDYFFNYYDYNSCYDKKIYFNAEESMFVCDLSEDDKNYLRKEALKIYIMENFDEISSITHKNEYKQKYRCDYCNKPYDWNFRDFSWTDDIFHIEFNDQSVDVKASLKIVDAEGILVEDFEIERLGTNENFDRKYYEKLPEEIKPIEDYEIENIENEN